MLNLEQIKLSDSGPSHGMIARLCTLTLKQHFLSSLCLERKRRRYQSTELVVAAFYWLKRLI